MRLTLRTLLAYLDNILDAKDADELRRKIEDSDFAKGLVQRIQSASARKRLGAPLVDGKGIGLDPNTVAEYLDNVLPPDRVPDLERVCLESDVHLAEVASCHQILTIVLGQAASVDPGLRERIYRIGSPDTDRNSASALPPANPVDSYGAGQYELGSELSADEGAYSPPPVPVAPPPVETAGRLSTASIRSAKAEVPEYLRAGQRSNWKPLVITLLLAFLLSAVALRAMGPFDRDHPLLRFASGRPAPVAQQDGSDRPALVEEATTVESDDKQIGGLPDEASQVPGQPDSTGKVPPSKEPPSELAAGLDSQPIEGSPRIDSESRAPESQDVEAADRPATPVDLAERDFPETQPLPPAVVEDPSSREGDQQLEPETAQAPDLPSAELSDEPVEVGFVKFKDLHFPLRFDAKTQEWYRLPGRSKLFSGDYLRVLPTFQPEIVLAPSVQIVFAGPSSVHLTPPTAEGEPTLTMDYGRAFVATAGVAGARLHLRLGERSCVVTFLDAASEIALETRSFLPVGSHPERDPVQRVVRVFPMIGRIEWQDDEQASPVPVENGQIRVLVDTNAETVSAGELPPWIVREDLREIDRSASAVLEGVLVADRPITLSLRERLQDRRTEVRALAAISLSYLDVHEALVAELEDPRQRAHWAAEFDALRCAISRSAESAATVRREFEKRLPNTAEEAYRLLFGFSPQQLAEGADESLVQMLDNPSMCLRILAFENLRRITGMTLLYRPSASDELRKSSVRGWRDRLDNRTILYDNPPTATSDRW
jgi:hypothetical protein